MLHQDNVRKNLTHSEGIQIFYVKEPSPPPEEDISSLYFNVIINNVMNSVESLGQKICIEALTTRRKLNHILASMKMLQIPLGERQEVL